MQREQLEQLLSSNSMLRSTFLMLYLKEDNVEAFFTLLGTELHTFGPIYLSECFPKETVLNLGIVKSWLRSLYLIAGCSKGVLMYVVHMLFLTLCMRIAKVKNNMLFTCWSHQQLLVCVWRHGGVLVVKNKKHFSPLGTKFYFHVNSSKTNSVILTTKTPPTCPPCHVVASQEFVSERLACERS